MIFWRRDLDSMIHGIRINTSTKDIIRLRPKIDGSLPSSKSSKVFGTEKASKQRFGTCLFLELLCGGSSCLTNDEFSGLERLLKT